MRALSLFPPFCRFTWSSKLNLPVVRFSLSVQFASAEHVLCLSLLPGIVPERASLCIFLMSLL